MAFDPRQQEPGTRVACTEATLVSAGGAGLHALSWRPEAPRASVAVVHGLAEHAERYAALASHLASHGFAVHAVDLRGHGRSPGTRVHVDSFGEYTADVAALRAHGAGAGLPLFLLGHSMGGLIAMLSARREPAGLAGLVVSSPFLAVHPALRPGPVLRAAVAVLLRLAPRLQVPSGADPAFVSRDPSVVEAYRTDPLVSRTVSAGWFRALGRAQHEARAAAEGWTVPTLMMAAGADRLVDVEATRDWVRRAPPGVVEAVEWPGLAHEIYNEPERQAVYARARSWMDERSAR